MTDDQIEQGAIILAFFNRGPRVSDNVTPRDYWQTWNPGAKQHYRAKVRAVLAANSAVDADAGLPYVLGSREPS